MQKLTRHLASFSDAIRLGATLRPQAFDWYVMGMSDGRKASCALGAAAEAITGVLYGLAEDEIRLTGDPVWVLSNTYPYTVRKRLACPASSCEHFCDDLLRAASHLNDTHHWTRERIADFVETEEEKIGYVTLLEPHNELSLETQNGEQYSPASVPEKVFL